SREDAKAERRRKARNRVAQVAEPDEAEGPALEPRPDVRKPLPHSVAHALILLEQPVREREHKRHRARGHRLPYAVGGDREQNALLGTRVDVDAVVADAEA